MFDAINALAVPAACVSAVCFWAVFVYATPWGYRLRVADILRGFPGWDWRSAWDYSAVILDTAREFQEDGPMSPAEAISVDMENW